MRNNMYYVKDVDLRGVNINKKDLSIFEVNLIYLISFLLLIFSGLIFNFKSDYLNIFLSQVLSVLLPSLAYIKIKNKSYKKVLKLNKISLLTVFKTIVISILSYAGIMLVNIIFVLIVTRFLPMPSESNLPLARTSMDLFKSIIFISLVPGIFEEIMFRGVIMDGYKRKGRNFSIIITSLLFALMHGNIYQFIAPLIIGIVYGNLVYRTGSILPAMIGHSTHNALVMVFAYRLLPILERLESVGLENLTDFDFFYGFLYEDLLRLGSISILIIILGILSIFLLPKLIKGIGKEDSLDYESLDQVQGVGRLKEYFPVAIVLIIYLLVNLSFLWLG